jgi:hypothetical protein
LLEGVGGVGSAANISEGRVICIKGRLLKQWERLLPPIVGFGLNQANIGQFSVFASYRKLNCSVWVNNRIPGG